MFCYAFHSCPTSVPWKLCFYPKIAILNHCMGSIQFNFIFLIFNLLFKTLVRSSQLVSFLILHTPYLFIKPYTQNKPILVESYVVLKFQKNIQYVAAIFLHVSSNFIDSAKPFLEVRITQSITFIYLDNVFPHHFHEIRLYSFEKKIDSISWHKRKIMFSKNNPYVMTRLE